MSVNLTINAETRSDMGKGASRRLRHAGKVPAIIYGSGKDPVSLTLEHTILAHQLDNESFYSSILTVNVDGTEESAILKDLQRHPSKPIIMHLDFQRVSDSETIRVHVPLHYINEAVSPGVQEGGIVSHGISEVEVQCYPKALPEYIEVDLSELALDATIHLTDIVTPEGVELVELLHGDSHNQAVASIHMPRAVKEETDDVPAAEGDEAAAAEGEGDSE